MLRKGLNYKTVMAVSIHSGLCVRNHSIFVTMAGFAMAQQQECGVSCAVGLGLAGYCCSLPPPPPVLYLDPCPQGSLSQNAPNSSTNSQDSFHSLELTQASILTFLFQFPHLKIYELLI